MKNYRIIPGDVLDSRLLVTSMYKDSISGILYVSLVSEDGLECGKLSYSDLIERGYDISRRLFPRDLCDSSGNLKTLNSYLLCPIECNIVKKIGGLCPECTFIRELILPESPRFFLPGDKVMVLDNKGKECYPGIITAVSIFLNPGGINIDISSWGLSYCSTDVKKLSDISSRLYVSSFFYRIDSEKVLRSIDRLRLISRGGYSIIDPREVCKSCILSNCKGCSINKIIHNEKL